MILNNKKAGVLNGMNEFILHLSRVEFTNSYQEHVNLTLHYHVQISSLMVIIRVFADFFHAFWINKIPPCGIYSYKVELILTKWNLLLQLTNIP